MNEVPLQQRFWEGACTLAALVLQVSRSGRRAGDEGSELVSHSSPVGRVGITSLSQRVMAE